MGKRETMVQTLTTLTGLHGDSMKGTLSGTYRGYTVVLERSNQNGQYMIFLSVQSANGSTPDKKNIRMMAKGSKAIAVSVARGYQLTVTVKSKMNAEKYAERIREALDDTTNYLRQNGYLNVCQLCGEPKQTEGIQLGLHTAILCPECYEKQAVAGMQRQQIQDSKSENVIGGIVGALLGSVIGAAVIVLLGQLGYVAVLSGIVMGVCTIKGYEILGGKLSKKSIVISALIMILMVWAGNRLDWSLTLQREVFIEDSIFTVFRYLNDGFQMLKTEGADISKYYTSLLMQYIFCAFGAVSMTITAIRNAGNANVITKI